MKIDYIYKNSIARGSGGEYGRHAIDILRYLFIHLRCIIRNCPVAPSQAQWRGLFDGVGFEVVFHWRKKVADHGDTPSFP